MDREPLNAVEGQAVAIEQRVERRHREVAEVLVVDRVELEAFDQLAHVRHLDLGDPVVGEDGRDALHEPVQVGHVGEHVVRDDHVGSLPLGPQAARELHAEELPKRRHADRLGRIRRPDGRGRSRARGCPRPRSCGAGSRRCSRARSRGCRTRDLAPRSAHGRGPWNARAASRRTRSSTSSSGRSPRAAPCTGAAPGCSWGRTRHRGGNGLRARRLGRAGRTRRSAASRPGTGTGAGLRPRTIGRSSRRSQEVSFRLEQTPLLPGNPTSDKRAVPC